MDIAQMKQIKIQIYVIFVATESGNLQSHVMILIKQMEEDVELTANLFSILSPVLEEPQLQLIHAFPNAAME